MQGSRETDERRRPYEYVGDAPLGAGKIPRQVEGCYFKRLPMAGCWQMGLFQRPVHIKTVSSKGEITWHEP